MKTAATTLGRPWGDGCPDVRECVQGEGIMHRHIGAGHSLRSLARAALGAVLLWAGHAQAAPADVDGVEPLRLPAAVPDGLTAGFGLAGVQPGGPELAVLALPPASTAEWAAALTRPSGLPWSSG